MDYPAARGGVSNTQTEKPLVASHGELDPKRLNPIFLWLGEIPLNSAQQ